MLVCPYCGKKPIIEHWSSGGSMFMVKCNSPDCWHPETYITGRNLKKVKEDWDRQVKGQNND